MSNSDKNLKLDNQKTARRWSRHINVVRRIYQQDAFNVAADYHSLPEHSFKAKLSYWIRNIGITDCLRDTLPIVKWLPKYNVKEYLFSDIIAGCTACVMHIPQGMGNSLLLGTPPVVGLYMAFFPVLIYVLVGKCPDVSMGTFAVACLMAGKVVRKHAVDTEERDAEYTPIQVISALSFYVGVLQVIMWVFRLGAVSALLSDPLVSGFTTGASFQVLASQLKNLFGITLPPLPTNYDVPFTVIEICKNIMNTNLAALIVSSITCLLLYLNNDFLKPWLRKHSRIPVPAELILVVVGTVASNHMEFHEEYDIKIVGPVPSGLPDPEIPLFEMFELLLFDVFSLTMVTYTIVISVGLIFATKKKYEIDANQELFALGTCNIVASFFNCAPLCCSLSRSFIQFTAGSQTMITSLISAIGVLCVLLFFGPYFEKLPRCVLSSIVVVSLKALFMQVKDLKRFCKLSVLDAAVWMITFLATAIINIDIGLGAGLIASVGALFIRSQNTYTCLLGRVMDTELYMDIERYGTAQELPNIKIFHYCGGLNFATKNQFRTTMLRKIGYLDCNKRWDHEFGNRIKCVIIDATALSYVDGPGIKSLQAVQKELAAHNVTTLMAGANGPVLEMIDKFNSLDNEDRLVLLTFPTVHDAVIHFHYKSLGASTTDIAKLIPSSSQKSFIMQP